jgi:two-component system chemotaxis response regulator CheY
MDTSIPILVVDDSQTIARLITKHLEGLGFSDIDCAQDGHAALDLIREKPYGLVISDWEMQPMGGHEFLKTLRQDSKFAKLPVILITGTVGRGSSWLSGADAYLSKPFSGRDFATAIKSVLGKQ